jgi:hypothetical protein
MIRCLLLRGIHAGKEEIIIISFVAIKEKAIER